MTVSEPSDSRQTADDLARTRRIAVEAMRRVPQVLTAPDPQALLASVGVTTVGHELRLWSGARQRQTREARDAVIESVLAAFAHAGVATGDDVRVVDSGPQLRPLLGDDVREERPGVTLRRMPRRT